jgi:hypothetical protein
MEDNWETKTNSPATPHLAPAPWSLGGPKHKGVGRTGRSLTAGFTAAVDRGHPEVCRARVEHHSELLGRGPDVDGPKVFVLRTDSSGSEARHNGGQEG